MIVSRTFRNIAAFCLLVSGMGLPGEMALAQSTVAQPENSEAVTDRETLTDGDKQIESTGSSKVSFSFDRAAWRDVFTWLAKEAGLALHMSEIPGGTFTYSDPSPYSPAEAIDRINMFLLPDGFSLVRSNGLLAVINLRDSRSAQRLDALARTVEPEQIDALEDHEVVKCFFKLHDLRPSDVVEELRRLQLMVEPTSLDSSKQVLVIDVAKKVRSAKQVIDALVTNSQGRLPLVQQVKLEHVTLEQVMDVARSHMGIEPGMFHNAEFNASSDDSGRRLFISGTPEAIKLFSGLVQIVDVPEALDSQANVAKELQSHRVKDENLRSVYEVLQTVLIGKDVRLSMEPATNSIVALATASVHQIISDTITELEGLETQFAVIPLRSIDPYFAITLLNEMFEIRSSSSSRRRDDDAASNQPTLKIDADPTGLRLFVRGPKDKVEEVRDVIEKLDRPDQTNGQRVVPIFGAKAESVLNQAKVTWTGENQVIERRSEKTIDAQIIERSLHEQDASAKPKSNTVHQSSETKPVPAATPHRPLDLVSTRKDEKPSEIEAQVTSRGIILNSQDEAALQDFETHLRTLGAGEEAAKVETIVYYLKYSSADEAAQLLADLIDGVTSLADTASIAKLVNSVVPSQNNLSLFGSYLRSGKDSPTLVSSGTLTVIADARLNRLICVGTTTDLRLVEQYLTVLDKDQSLTEIETHGKSHVLELQHAKASEIADVIRDTYGDRVALSTEQKRQAQQAQRPNDQERSKESQSNVQSSRNTEQQMHVAVHEISNSIVVTASDALFEDVKQLVERLDQGSEQAVEVIFYPSPQGVEMLRETLMQEERSRGRSRRDR